jgi:hypothetical protein
MRIHLTQGDKRILRDCYRPFSELSTPKTFTGQEKAVVQKTYSTPIG